MMHIISFHMPQTLHLLMIVFLSDCDSRAAMHCSEYRNEFRCFKFMHRYSAGLALIPWTPTKLPRQLQNMSPAAPNKTCTNDQTPPTQAADAPVSV